MEMKSKNNKYNKKYNKIINSSNYKKVVAV